MPKFENNIPGMISQLEGTILTHLSSTCPPNTTIVNIGCWEGRSLRYMLDGHPPPNCSIYAIDLHIDNDILHKNVLVHDHYPINNKLFHPEIQVAVADFLRTPNPTNLPTLIPDDFNESPLHRIDSTCLLIRG